MNTDASLSELTKALLSLEGLLHGITADDIINQKELEMLKKWKRLNYERSGITRRETWFGCLTQ